MRRTILHIPLLIICLTTAIEAKAGSTGQPYYEWMKLPSDELIRMGNRFRDGAQLMDSAMMCYTIVANRYDPAQSFDEKRLTVEALNEIGVLNTNYFGNQGDACRNLIQADEICRDIGYEEMQPYILLNLGNLFNLYEFLFPSDDGQQHARQYYRQCLSEARRQQEWDMVMASYINLGMLDMPYTVDADLHRDMQRLLSDSIPHDATDWALCFHFMEGSLALADRRYDEAMACFREMERHLGNGPDADREQYMVYMCQATVCFQQGDYENALAVGRNILNMESLQDLTDIRTETFRLQAECYDRMGLTDEANRRRIEFLQEKEKLTRSVVGLLPTQLTHDLQQVSTAMEQARRQKRVREAGLIGLSAVVVLLVGFMLLLGRKNRLLREKNMALYRKTKEEITPSMTPQPKYKDSQLKDDKKQMLVTKIHEAMENTAEICQPTFTLQRLAEMVGSNTSYLSQIINDTFGMTFTTLLNQARIREACRRLDDREHYAHLTIDAVSESVGFKARVTFTKAFRLYVGMLPSEYVKMGLSAQTDFFQQTT